MRKIIQIVAADGETLALCNDGTFWMWCPMGKQWEEWCKSIPQPDEFENTID